MEKQVISDDEDEEIGKAAGEENEEPVIEPEEDKEPDEEFEVQFM